ncbi:kxDL motif-containing protein 1 [Parasteatoda tepidariorum]|uniref:kxDL motif-containing protein 1 n=1 Tax=Parasteatoda tepidariorum TaxID=114398 RepID=UPI00077F99D3|nr:kxDL motif-containing protein 1 [Parasteatoda tepidariorum]
MSSNNLKESNAAENSSHINKLSAPVAFTQSLQHQVNEDDICAIIQSQKHMLSRFEKTNEMLVNCNSLLTSRYLGASKELKKQKTFLIDLKKDLESVFRRIRFLKMKLSQQYTEAFSASSINVLDEEEEQDEKETETGTSTVKECGTINASSSGSRGSSPCSISSPSTSDT